jgi:hypothetical protein
VPGRVNAGDMPKAWRRKNPGGGGPAPVVTGPVENTPRNTPRKAPPERIAWKCTRCGTCGDTYAALERHAARERHFRFDTLR